MTALKARGPDLDDELEARALDYEHERANRYPEIVDTRLSVRAQALAQELQVTQVTHVRPLWRSLTQGRSRVADGFFSGDRCYLLIAHRPRPVRPMDTRRLEILQAVLRGAPQKCIAIEHQLAASTVALHTKLALENLGVPGRPSRTHPLLMHLARSASRSADVRCSELTVDAERAYRVLSIPRPEQPWRAVLPGAEFEVVQSLVEGLSYQDIAERRDTSTRTVANQISAVFRRLQVSGRNALVERLFLDQEARGSRRTPFVVAS